MRCNRGAFLSVKTPLWCIAPRNECMLQVPSYVESNAARFGMHFIPRPHYALVAWLIVTRFATHRDYSQTPSKRPKQMRPKPFHAALVYSGVLYRKRAGIRPQGKLRTM